MSFRQTPIDGSYFTDEHAADPDFTAIGKVVDRVDARGHVTGRTEFFEDVAAPRMLHLKMHRSARHHARIRGVELSAALAVPGVVRILTHADVPNNLYTPLKLIGVGLYRHLLARALEVARGKAVPEDWSPELNIGAASRIPAPASPGAWRSGSGSSARPGAWSWPPRSPARRPARPSSSRSGP